MGYTTDFNGQFKLNKPLDNETLVFLQKLNETRRMVRDAKKLKADTGVDYGIDGEFFVDGDGFAGQGESGHVLDHNRPPRTQPGLWCQWRPTDDGTAIEWDQGEKFYNYVEWLEYIVTKVLAPKGYILNGAVQWRGENFDDMGTILVDNNKVSAIAGKHIDAKPKRKPKAKAPKLDKGYTCQLLVKNGKNYIALPELVKYLDNAKSKLPKGTESSATIAVLIDKITELDAE